MSQFKRLQAAHPLLLLSNMRGAWALSIFVGCLWSCEGVLDGLDPLDSVEGPGATFRQLDGGQNQPPPSLGGGNTSGSDAGSNASGGGETRTTDAGSLGGNTGSTDAGTGSGTTHGTDAGSGGSSGVTPVTVEPPLGGSSKGTGGAFPVTSAPTNAGGVSFLLTVPPEYQANTPWPLLIVYSGVERANTMMNNLNSAGPVFGVGDFMFAVLDGVNYRGNGQAGAQVLDYLRSRYNIDNDRTYLLGESAGTSAALQLGFKLRQSYFAAYWANDVNDTLTPGQTAAQLGFAPWGQVGPGGQSARAQAIVDGMKAAGYRMDTPSPYAGPGANFHGDPQQFYAALRWFASGKSRRP